MSPTIEEAKTGRAKCRTCREGIAKGELRFGEPAPNPYSETGEMTLIWHHLRCAAKKKPNFAKIALAAFEGEVPDREAIEALIEGSKLKNKPTAFPYAERAPTGRSRCKHCHEMIEKASLRVAIQDEVNASPVMGGPRFLHARCASAALGDPLLPSVLATNSTELSDGDRQALAEQLGAEA